MPLISTRVLVTAALVIGIFVVGVLVVKPALEPDAQDGPTLGGPVGTAGPEPTVTSPPPAKTDGGEPDSSPPPAARQPTNAAEVVVTFPQALAALRRRIGVTAELTDLNVNEISVLFSHRTGRDRVEVLRWRPELGRLETADRAFAGTGDVAEKAFPLGVVTPGMPARLVAAVRRTAPRGHVIHTVHLFRNPVTRALMWQLTVEVDGGYRTYRAAPSGAGFHELR